MNLPPEMQSLNFSRGSAIAVAATCAFLAGSWLSSIPLSETLVFRYGIFWMVASIALTTVLLNEVGQNGLYWLLVGAIPFTGWLSVRYFTQSRQLQLKSSFAIAIVCIHALFAGLMFFGFPLL
jgi:hypothetical protein